MVRLETDDNVFRDIPIEQFSSKKHTWSQADRRLMNQHLSRYQIVTRQMLDIGADELLKKLGIAKRSYKMTVWTKVKSALEYQVRNAGKLQKTTLIQVQCSDPQSGKMVKVWRWPKYTLRWLRPDWDGDVDRPSDGEDLGVREDPPGERAAKPEAELEDDDDTESTGSGSTVRQPSHPDPRFGDEEATSFEIVDDEPIEEDRQHDQERIQPQVNLSTSSTSSNQPRATHSTPKRSTDRLFHMIQIPSTPDSSITSHYSTPIGRQAFQPLSIVNGGAGSGTAQRQGHDFTESIRQLSTRHEYADRWPDQLIVDDEADDEGIDVDLPCPPGGKYFRASWSPDTLQPRINFPSSPNFPLFTNGHVPHPNTPAHSTSGLSSPQAPISINDAADMNTTKTTISPPIRLPPPPESALALQALESARESLHCAARELQYWIWAEIAAGGGDGEEAQTVSCAARYAAVTRGKAAEDALDAAGEMARSCDEDE